MNTQLKRADFSPIAPRRKTSGAAMFSPRSADEAPVAGHHASLLAVGQFWTPGLLDRLQEPLTRYHE